MRSASAAPRSIGSQAPKATPALTDDAAVGRAVLEAEQAGLAALSASLGDEFNRAVEALASISGRIVVTGMGKSGHIARKIAATFSSTGMPALFIHPAEASHGDLGMIQPGDAVLALSNSGETAELADIVAHTRRFGLKLVAITGRAQSTLALAADLVLLLPPAPEACPMGLAPTTSTTMQLALGDALAVALLGRHDFSASDFRTFHPGGRLGARLLHVREIMHQGARLPLAGPETPMRQALLMMTGSGFGCLGVVTDGRLSGIVTDGDLRRHMGPELLDRTVGMVMTENPLTIGPDALAAEALRLMNERRNPITSLFVVDQAGAAVGLLHVHDLLRAGII